MLTEEQIDSYFENGQVTAPFKLSDDVIGSIRTKMEALFETRPDLTPDYLPALIEMDRSWLEFAMLPEILDIVEQLIGPDIIVWSSALFCKSPSNGKATPWHQDAQYWPIRPLETTTVWIAVDPSTRENGCLRVVPGSHKSRQIFSHSINNSDRIVLNQELDSEVQKHLNPKDVELERGMFSFHDAFMVHGAEPNHSSKRRASLTYRYMPASSHFDRDLARKKTEVLQVGDVSERQIFQVRGNYSHPDNQLSTL